MLSANRVEEGKDGKNKIIWKFASPLVKQQLCGNEYVTRSSIKKQILYLHFQKLQSKRIQPFSSVVVLMRCNMIIRTELIPLLLLISRKVVILSVCQLLCQVSSNFDVWLTIFLVISQHGDNHHDHRKKFTFKDLYQIRCFLLSRILYNNTFALISTLVTTF